MLPYEVIVIGVPSKVRGTERKTVVGARVDHPKEADDQGLHAQLTASEQVEDRGFGLILGSLLLRHHRGHHRVDLGLIQLNFVPLSHLLDLFLRLRVFLLKYLSFKYLFSFTHVGYLPADGLGNDPPVGDEEDGGQGQGDLEEEEEEEEEEG